MIELQTFCHPYWDKSDPTIMTQISSHGVALLVDYKDKATWIKSILQLTSVDSRQIGMTLIPTTGSFTRKSDWETILTLEDKELISRLVNSLKFSHSLNGQLNLSKLKRSGYGMAGSLIDVIVYTDQASAIHPITPLFFHLSSSRFHRYLLIAGSGWSEVRDFCGFCIFSTGSFIDIYIALSPNYQ